MLIRIDAIRENGNLRRVKTSAAADAALTASIQAQGVLCPILVRDDGNGYVLIAGRRRLHCAATAGLEHIPAEVQQMTDGWAVAAQAAENMVREPMHPVDQWLAVKELIAGGFTFQNAGPALGLDDRQMRRMERLGSLHPKVLQLIETYGLPRDTELRLIAGAPHSSQAKAVKIKDAIREWNGEKQIHWIAIADACRVTRYNRGDALFDPKLIEWDVDLFAQPGAPDEYTTTDGETFLRFQRAALQEQVEAAQAKKKRVQLAEFDTMNHAPKLPAGFARVWNGDAEKPRRFETVFVALSDHGTVNRVVAQDRKAAAAAEKKKTERAAKQRGADPEADDDASDDDHDASDAPAPVAEKPGITKTGLGMIAAAKTAALRDTLRDGIAEVPPEQLLVLMVLAWGARNVSVQGVEMAKDDYDPNRRNFRDLAARVLLPGGILDQVPMADARGLAGEIMARVLSFSGPGTSFGGSGVAAEWIGAAIGADHALPRFDTAEFLQHVGGDELRRAAADAGEKGTGTVKVLRERLVGKLPTWRPSAAAFGAAAPQLLPTDDDEDDEADASEGESED